jgi:hypothetical protein
MATVGGPPWQLPVSLMGAAVAAQVAGTAVLVAVAPGLADGAWYGPDQLAAVHLLGLGFLTVAIVAALLQLVPVLLRRRLGAPRRSAAAGAALALGAWALAWGLWASHDALTAAGGSLLVLGGGVMVVDLARAVWGAARAGTLGAPGAGIAASTLWFALVLAAGAAMAANRVHPFLEVDRTRLMAAHAAVAIVGWIGGTIVAIALRLAPMFALAHGHRTRVGQGALVAWHASVVPLALGLLLGVAPLAAAGGAVLLGACLAAGWFAVDVARHRRRRPEAPLVHLLIGLASALAAVAVMLAAWAGGGDPYRAAIPAAILALVGMGAGTTSGHLFKVVPMLVWTGRYATRAGTPGAPRLADLYPAPLAAAEQALFAAGLALLAGGVAAGSGMAARAGAALLMAAAVAVAAAVATTVVGRGGTRRAAPPDTFVHPLTGGAP